LRGAATPIRRLALIFRHRQFLPRSAAVLLACWALALISPELYRVGNTLFSLGLSVNNNGVIVDVTDPFPSPDQSPAAIAGLVAGDRIDLEKMNCLHPRSAACAAIMPVMGDDGEMGYTRANFQAAFDVLAGPDATPRVVLLRAAPAAMPWLDRLLLLAGTIAGFIVIGGAFFLVWQRPGRMSWGFFLYAIWFNPGQDYTFYTLLQPWPAALLTEQLWEAVIQGAAYAGLLIFAIRFPTGETTPSWRRIERALPWLGGVIAICTACTGANLFTIPSEGLNQIVFSSGFVFDAAAIAVLLLRLPSLPPQDEQRMRWAIAGCVIGIPCFLVAELCSSTSLPVEILGVTPPQSVPAVLYLLQGVMIYFVGIALYRRRVVSVAIPLRRGATLTGLTFLLGVPILYLHEAITRYTESRDLPSWIWGLFIGPLVLVVLARLHEFATEYTERAFNRRYHLARETLHKATLAIAKAADFTAIDAVLTEAPAAALRLASVAVFRMVDRTLHRVGPSIGWSGTDLQQLDPAQYPAFFARLLDEKPVPLPRNEWDRPNVPRDDLYPCLAVPIRGGVTESIAVIFCGPHLSGADISFDERELLQDFAARAALSYDRVEANQLRQEIQELRAALSRRESSSFSEEKPGR
jgi:hypothetical protein